MGHFFQLISDFFYSLFRGLLRILDPRQWRLPESKPKTGKRRFGLSIPVACGLISFFFWSGLFLTLVFTRQKDYSVLLDRYGWLIFLFIVVFSVMLYYFVRLYLQDDYENFEDIDEAWELGLAELYRRQIDIKATPVFLLIGAENRERTERLFAAAAEEFEVQGYPKQNSALHWYANKRSIYIVASEVGCLTAISRRSAAELKSTSGSGEIRGELGRTMQAEDLGRTFWPSEEPMVEGQEKQEPKGSLIETQPDFGAQLGSTMMVGSADEYLRKRTEGAVALRKDYSMTRNQSDEHLSRLAQVCRLLQRVRAPYEPVNGVVALFPINLILCDSSDGAFIKEATGADLRTITDWLQLRCPSYAVVTDLEDDLGFQEMIRRLGPRYTRGFRFGKGVENVADLPHRSSVEAVGNWACRSFEDWIYRLFAQADALQKPGNRSLYNLLCRVRRYLRPRLLRVLSEGFSTVDQSEQGTPFFGGCYFVAAGNQSARQAFVPKLFERFIAEANKVEWTDEAIRNDQMRLRIVYALSAGSFILILVAVAFAWLRFFVDV